MISSFFPQYFSLFPFHLLFLLCPQGKEDDAEADQDEAGGKEEGEVEAGDELALAVEDEAEEGHAEDGAELAAGVEGTGGDANLLAGSGGHDDGDQRGQDLGDAEA